MPIRTSKSAPTRSKEIQLRSRSAIRGSAWGSVSACPRPAGGGGAFQRDRLVFPGNRLRRLRCEAGSSRGDVLHPGAQKERLPERSLQPGEGDSEERGHGSDSPMLRDLNAVRNLLLDWVRRGLGGCRTGSGRAHDQVGSEASADGASARPAVQSNRQAWPAGRLGRVLVLGIGCAPGCGPRSCTGCDMDGLLEKETALPQRLASGVPFAVAGFQ